jgi:hypothetical protein
LVGRDIDEAQALAGIESQISNILSSYVGMEGDRIENCTIALIHTIRGGMFVERAPASALLS